MQLTLCLLSTYISLFDWKFHRISNNCLLISFVVLTAVGRITDSELHIVGSMIVLLICLVGYKFGVGAGDVKLIVLLSTFFLPNTSAGLVDLVGGFAVASLILISLHRLKGRSLGDPIALAPAICAAFIWCAR